MTITREQLTPGTRFRGNGRGFHDLQSPDATATYVALADDGCTVFPHSEFVHAVKESEFTGDVSVQSTSIFAMNEIGEIL